MQSCGQQRAATIGVIQMSPKHYLVMSRRHSERDSLAADSARSLPGEGTSLAAMTNTAMTGSRRKPLTQMLMSHATTQDVDSGLVRSGRKAALVRP
jgi:hypothetical protein